MRAQDDSLICPGRGQRGRQFHCRLEYGMSNVQAARPVRRNSLGK